MTVGMRMGDTAVVWNRDGYQHAYTLNPGEDWRLLRDGTLIITHPERRPFAIRPTGEMVHLEGL